jgi:hypothetical protein
MRRLPQAITLSLSIRVSSVVTLTAFVTIFSMGARGVTQQLTCTPTSLSFRTVTVGRTETQLAILKNSGHTSVTVSAMKLSGREFSVSHITLPLHLSAGESVALNVMFAPTATGWTGGKVTFTSNASNSTLPLALEGTGVTSEAVKASPSSISFGQVVLGRSSKVSVVLTNTRSWKIRLAAFYTTGNGFSVTGPTLPLVLQGGQSVKLNVKFAPRAAGLVGGSVVIRYPGVDIPLRGTGTSISAGQLLIAPAPLNFGDVTVQTTQTRPITMSAAGASVTLSSAASSSSQFVLEGTAFPLTIAAGESVSFHVAFTPRSSGTISGSLSFASNASNSHALESLTGIGTVTSHSVSLWWNASTSSDVAGYNVYRSATANGSYARINATLDSNTAYKDDTVVSGNTYYYAATAVNSSGRESARSTPIEAVVP